jgi:anti-sigma factor ChrR (cupin superfamily)
MTSRQATTTINGDMSRRAVVHTAAMAWVASPSAGVWRKRLHHVGPPEAGQVTSLVKFEGGARFPMHDHPEGEEILVLDGRFSDEAGDCPAGTYLLNPEGFRHAPFSREGCVIFVKLRQYAGREHLVRDTSTIPWTPTPLPGVYVKTLHADLHGGTSTRLERWTPGTTLGSRSYEGGVELLVLDGELRDERGAYGPGAWLRLPPHSHHAPSAPGGCSLYVKSGAVSTLRSVPGDAA